MPLICPIFKENKPRRGPGRRPGLAEGKPPRPEAELSIAVRLSGTEMMVHSTKAKPRRMDQHEGERQTNSDVTERNNNEVEERDLVVVESSNENKSIGDNGEEERRRLRNETSVVDDELGGYGGTCSPAQA